MVQWTFNPSVLGSNPSGSSNAGIAQTVEQLPRKHQVVGSIPATSTRISVRGILIVALRFQRREAGLIPAGRSNLKMLREMDTLNSHIAWTCRSMWK